MMDVGGVERATAAGLTARPRAGLPLSGFAMPGAALPASTVSSGQPPQAAAALAGLLVLQEADTEAPRNRAARRRGQDILAALAALQRALLAGGGSDDVMARLAALTADLPPALDLGLDRILRAITLRARVELARRQPDTSAARSAEETPT